MSEAFRVAVSKDYLSFSSAHFITMRGHQCEALHGHNYRVGVTVEGGLDPESHFVIDFSILKQIVRKLVDAIDHRVLLPADSPRITLHDRGEQVAVDVFGEARYVFPKRDCAILPIANSTAERLAEYLAKQVRLQLVGQGVTHLTRLEIEVEESPGQTATFAVVDPHAG
ncbi:MAG TPA: 6-carboxytetrahydropterin synthase [Gemmatimonadales bacterium]|nr:6-carboxytetrahydropterin synthase [Gemmatimonadales bacterium]